MTLGPALLFLAWADNDRGKNLVSRIFITFGRVPLFYFVLQMFLAHGMGVFLSYITGKGTGYLFLNFPASVTEAPPDAGFPLWVAYAGWLVGLVILYPLCRWYGNLKERHHGFPLSYL